MSDQVIVLSTLYMESKCILVLPLHINPLTVVSVSIFIHIEVHKTALKSDFDIRKRIIK